MEAKDIPRLLPYSSPFLFVDHILAVDETGITGTFRFDGALDFYKGHFSGYPVTPGVILTETMAQIGLVSLGIYLIRNEAAASRHIMLTSASVDFMKPVFPGETVTVVSTKNYFRFKKLSCNVKMLNENGEEVCSGSLAGMLTTKMHD